MATATISPDTKLAKVYNALKRRAAESPEHVVEITGKELARELGMKLDQVHDSIYWLLKKNLIKKERTGARFRPMVLRVLEQAEAQEKPEEFNNLQMVYVRCLNCGHRIPVNPVNLVELCKERIQNLEEAAKKLREVVNVFSQFGN